MLFMRSFIGGLAIGLVPGIIVGTIVYKVTSMNQKVDAQLEYYKALNNELEQFMKDHGIPSVE